MLFNNSTRGGRKMKKSGKIIMFSKVKKEKRNTTIQGKVYPSLGLMVTQYYSHGKDSMIVKVEKDGYVFFEKFGADITFLSWVEAIEMFKFFHYNKV